MKIKEKRRNEEKRKKRVKEEKKEKKERENLVKSRCFSFPSALIDDYTPPLTFIIDGAH